MWQDLNTIKGRSQSNSSLLDLGPGREIIYPGALRPQLVNYIIYDQTGVLPALYQTVLCCPANLETNSAALRYIFCEHNTDAIFRLRPEVGNLLTLPQSKVNGFPQTNVISRSTPRSPMTADLLFSCLERLKTLLTEHDASNVHLSIIDPEHPLCNLYGFHSCLMDIFADTPLSKVLHDPTYVSIASMTQYLKPIL